MSGPDHLLCEADERVLADLGERCAESGLALMLRCYRDVGSRTGVLRFDRTFLPNNLGSLIDLMCLGAAVSQAEAAAHLGDPALALLIRLGIIEQRGEMARVRDLRLIDHFGALLLVGAPGPLNQVYFGQDSTALGNVLLGAVRGRTLDICCGSGAQTILCAGKGVEVVGLERSVEALKIASVNAALNGLGRRIQFVETDVLDWLDMAQTRASCIKGPFDTICCNPPLLPVPAGEAFPLVGNGGEDALRFTTAVLCALDPLLAPNGRLYMIGTILGSNNGPDLDRLRSVALDHRLCIRMIVPARQNLGAEQPFRRALELTSTSFGGALGIADYDPARSGAAWDELISQGDHLFSFYLMARHAKGEAPSLDISPYYVRNQDFWFI